ncbi:hypothetical protein SH1V18_07800 [Vallitalea longa]|uniref:Uncharacterized protein n=1 Tax=Vallitalea longa TaxID=2936439 RepID=A0A9W5Y7J0_9FIRM|nr:hypothetical protein [Vallitalea longa]GKX28300.1 hypothetical protein SH1V18_07800 [Vallitalea longa]
MIETYSSLFNVLIQEIVDDRLKNSLTNNIDIQKEKSFQPNFEEDFRTVFERLEEKDKKAIDDYLCMNNAINSIIFCDMYRYGFYDCIKLLKELKVL